MRKLEGLIGAAFAALLLAVASTLGDLVWALWIPAHLAVYGLIHGALLFMFLGLTLGLLASLTRPQEPAAPLLLRAAGSELAAGLGGAAAFYALFPVIGWAAMFVAWMGIWVLTAFLNRWIRGTGESFALTSARGLGAAALSGAAFWAISGIWLGGSTGNPDYPVNFASWFVAYFPGFACLLYRAPPRG